MSTVATTPQRVFISYRREDSAAYAGRIYDAMVARFGESNVFMDVEMAPGVDFVEQIDTVVSSCAALIVVIGPSWATIEGDDGVPRLHEPTDFVRQEVTAACQRSDVTVIPALVNKAQMPRTEQLPDGMQPLARRNALELSDVRWRYDVGRLSDTLDELLDGYTGFGTKRAAEPPAPAPPPAPPLSPVPPAQLLGEGVAVAAASGFLGRLLADAIPKLSGGDASQIANPVLRQTLTWALVGVALALWVAARNRRSDFGYAGLLGLLIGAIAGAVGTLVWAIPVDPPVDLEQAADVESSENWTVANIALTGAMLGALIGTLWRGPHRAAGFLAGLLAGALVQLAINAAGWNTSAMPDLAFVFALRAAAIAAAAVATMLLLSRRSSAAARAPALR